VIGGLFRRGPHQFDGQIAAVRVLAGAVADDALNPDPARWTEGTLVWRASQENNAAFAWSGGAMNAESGDPHGRAMADLCHVLLNSNDFLFLH